jgi:hypothetical protein
MEIIFGLGFGNGITNNGIIMHHTSHAERILGMMFMRYNVPGKDLREELNKGLWFWQRWSAPGFYFFMHQLEEKGLIKGDWQVKTIGDQTIKVKVYSHIT